MYLKLMEGASSFATEGGADLRLDLRLCDDTMGEIASYNQQQHPITLPPEILTAIRAFTESTVLPAIAAATGMSVELATPPEPAP